MSFFNDLANRSVMNEKLLTLGGGINNKRTLDLSPLGITGLTTADVQILAGEHSTEKKNDKLTWIESFMVKSPQILYTPSKFGLSKKRFQYTLWVKTPLVNGLYFNEAVSGLIEEHFKNNLHLPLPNGDVVTILKTYQQATIVVENGRFFNRVFVDCEVYYESRQ